jgi:hypothetical protein
LDIKHATAKNAAPIVNGTGKIEVVVKELVSAELVDDELLEFGE